MAARTSWNSPRWLVIAVRTGAGCVAARSDTPSAAPASGSVGMGQRLFDANCARCRGAAAQGTAAGPDRLSRVRGMSRERFADAVLRRYSWSVPAGEAAGDSGLSEAMVRPAAAPSRGPAVPRAAVRETIATRQRHGACTDAGGIRPATKE